MQQEGIEWLIVQGISDWVDVSTLEEPYVEYADVTINDIVYEFTGEERTCSPPIPIYRKKKKELTYPPVFDDPEDNLERLCAEIHKILDDPDDIKGVSREPWQSVRLRLYDLKRKLREKK